MNDYPPAWDGPPPLPAPRRRSFGPSRMPRWVAIGAVALALVLALGVGVLIGSGTLSTFANSDVSSAQRHGGFGAVGNAGFANPAGRGFGHGLTVVSNNGTDTITATRTDRSGTSTTVTIKTSSSTTYGEPGKTITLRDIVKDMKIGVQGTKNSDGSISATRIEVILPSYHGAVTAVSGNDITVKDPRDSSTHVIHTNANGATTAFTRAGKSASLSDVAVGDNVNAEGILNSDNTLNAQAVQIILPRAGGKITAINGSAVTVQDRRGTATINLQDSTTYFTVTKGTSGLTQTAASKSDLAVGKYIMAEGTKSSDGSLNAETVRILPTPASGATGGPRFGPGAPGGPGGWPGMAPKQ